ncbi:YcnI family protein [Quadrisphaera sp. INWT6]|uniref:YcnI family copper-binding membrane protein n=1 Tax=Quadrisphaera sp. INWT6 TaxID=2596917 RepID=UPI0019D5CDA2|nr:YcnI family protein [Quadrisphaera sp. INWT6]
MPTTRPTRPTTRSTHRPAPRLRPAAATALAAALVLLPAAAASAHVRVVPDSTAAGGYALLTFRVPNESSTASTTRVQVTLPTDHPLTYAAVQPVPGWTAQVAEAALPAPVDVGGATITTAPRTVTWTAEAGSGIAPGQFQQFPLSVGPLPDAGTTVLLPAVQTYSDGTEVSWDEPVPASGEEPEHPAPELVTTAAAAEEHAGHDGSASASSAAASGEEEEAATGWGAGGWLGLTGAVLGAAGLVVALLGRRRTA